MLTSDQLKIVAQIKKHEGAARDADGNHVVYRCPAGKRTIGYGHNLDANPVPGIGDTISEDQAVRLLVADVTAIQESLENNIRWAHTLAAPRYAVLVNMAFNLGVGGVLAFKKMLEHCRAGNHRAAANEMLASRWAAQVGQRAINLARQMETGSWRG